MSSTAQKIRSGLHDDSLVVEEQRFLWPGPFVVYMSVGRSVGWSAAKEKSKRILFLAKKLRGVDVAVSSQTATESKL